MKISKEILKTIDSFLWDISDDVSDYDERYEIIDAVCNVLRAGNGGESCDSDTGLSDRAHTLARLILAIIEILVKGKLKGLGK